MSSVRELRERLVQAGIARPSEIRGCTAEEIEEVRATQGLPLPRVYEEFLREMGRGAGAFLRGTDVFYPRVLQVHEWALDLLAEDGAETVLPSGAFVFLSHQGYQFMFFPTGQSDDPAVYFYREQARAAQQRFDSFSSFLASSIESHARG